MNDEIELLEYLYQVLKESEDGLLRIRKEREKNDGLDDYIFYLINEYRKLSKSAKLMIERRSKDVKENGFLSKLANVVSAKINVSKAKNDSQIIAVILQASTVNINEIKKRMQEYNISSKTIYNLIDRIIYTENENINTLNEFLKK